MRAVRKGERRPTSSVFKSIESLSRFNDRSFDPFPSALVFFFLPHQAMLLSRITRVIARLLLASRIGRIHKLFVERKSERSFLPSFLSEEIWKIDKKKTIGQISKRKEKSSLQENLDLIQSEQSRANFYFRWNGLYYYSFIIINLFMNKRRKKQFKYDILFFFNNTAKFENVFSFFLWKGESVFKERYIKIVSIFSNLSNLKIIAKEEYPQKSGYKMVDLP